MRFKNLKAQVEHCLLEYPETRDSDVELTIRIWREFYPQHLTQAGDVDVVPLACLFQLPREDSCKRIRAHFQNTLALYPPQSLEVVKQRRINENEWRKTTGNVNAMFAVDVR